MARNTSLYPATLPISEQEEHVRQDFITAYTSEYSITSASDKILLELASIELVKAIRLQVHELDTHNIITAARQHPIGTLTRLLEAMDATRAARMRKKQPDSTEDDQMREYFLSLGLGGQKANGAVPVNGHKYKSLEDIPTNVLGKTREEMSN